MGGAFVRLALGRKTLFITIPDFFTGGFGPCRSDAVACVSDADGVALAGLGVDGGPPPPASPNPPAVGG